ncbi:MAG TPA: hypothetical protein VN577_01195 [Terriglobales bacterium]|nr:hypothetical protein [Terriglobales bacterium]
MQDRMTFSSLAILSLSVFVVLFLAACGGGSSLGTNVTTASTNTTLNASTISAPSTVVSGQAGYSASVTSQAGATYSWTASNATIMVGANSDNVAFTAGISGTMVLTAKVTTSSGTSTASVTIPITAAKSPQYNIEQAVSDGAQSSTIAFSGFGMMTGNLGAQSFFPPGKVADYWGFQYLRDNDADNMGHNTSFLTRVACNMLYILNDTQISALKTLAAGQVNNINLYAWKRYPLMKAFRRLMDGTIPTGSTGLSVDAIKAASRDLYLLDGQLSYERAVVYADVYRSLTATQKGYIAQMVGKGFNSWPVKAEDDVRSKTSGLSHDEVVALMTYAGDLYAWYAGSVTADVYFCPERHGTYFGSFYIKDAPAVGHADYSIDEQTTATVGRALTDSTQGYISADGAAKMNALTAIQKENLYGNSAANIVLARTKISEALRSLISSTAPSSAALSQVKATVDQYSALYGELDGENNYYYATTFYELYQNVGGSYINYAQKTALAALRKKYMTVTYSDGTTVDYSTRSTSYLYASEIPSSSADLANYTSDLITDPLFKFN